MAALQVKPKHITTTLKLHTSKPNASRFPSVSVVVGIVENSNSVDKTRRAQMNLKICE